MESERTMANRPNQLAEIAELAATPQGRMQLLQRAEKLRFGVRQDPSPPADDLSAQLSSLAGGTQAWEYAVIQNVLQITYDH